MEKNLEDDHPLLPFFGKVYGPIFSGGRSGLFAFREGNFIEIAI